MIVGFVGLIGSGKDTAADYLISSFGYSRDSFAGPLKDAVSSVFGWDRELLEGRSQISREWREKVDEWWANRLSMPHLTPRWVLQYWGTDVFRNHFHQDIWIASLENKLCKSKGNVVITDCRFQNEAMAIKNAGGKVIRIKRGIDPEWFEFAREYPQHMIQVYPEIHASEYCTAAIEYDHLVTNDGSVHDLCDQIKNLV